MEKCQCRPPYFPKYKDYDNCTFSMHASCISPNFTVFNFTTCVNCPVECEKNRWAVLFDWYNDWFSYVRNVEYGKYHEPIYRTLEKFSQSTGNQDIDIAAFQVDYLIVFKSTDISALFSFACYNCSQSNRRLHHESIRFWTWWCCRYRSWCITLHHCKKWVLQTTMTVGEMSF